MNATQDEGYLVVKVSTARGAIPLVDASVTVRGGDAETSGVLYALRTDRDGKTPRVTLPTPPKSASQTPGTVPPYAVYNIDVFKDGYIPLFFQQVPIFPAVLSVQPAVMVPAEQPSGGMRSPYGQQSSEVIPENPETAL